MSFKIKVVFLTGAASGIGFEIARQFAKEGANVVITDLNTNKISYAVSSLKNEYLDILDIECDVTNEHQIMAAYRQNIPNLWKN